MPNQRDRSIMAAGSLGYGNSDYNKYTPQQGPSTSIAGGFNWGGPPSLASGMQGGNSYGNPAYNQINTQSFSPMSGGLSDMSRYNNYNASIADGSGWSMPDTGVNATGGVLGNLGGPQADAATKSGFNWGEGGFGLGSIMGIAQTLGGFGQLYAGFQQNKLAKKNMKFQQDAYKTNLANEIKTYNSSLESRTRLAHQGAERSQEETDAYINKHKL